MPKEATKQHVKHMARSRSEMSSACCTFLADDGPVHFELHVVDLLHLEVHRWLALLQRRKGSSEQALAFHLCQSNKVQSQDVRSERPPGPRQHMMSSFYVVHLAAPYRRGLPVVGVLVRHLLPLFAQPEVLIDARAVHLLPVLAASGF